jgi:ABC-type nitrate/sulfonate/bicarbonate transport system permease component
MASMSASGHETVLPPVGRQIVEEKKRKARRRDVALRLVSVISFFALWEIVTQINGVVVDLFNPILIPSPGAVFQVGLDMLRSGELLSHIFASLSRVVQGFVLASIMGVVMGVAVSRSTTLSSLFEPIVEMFRPIPSLAFLPIFVLWFGIGEMSKVVFIAYATFFPVFTSTAIGVRQIDPVLLRAAATLGASKSDIFRYVELPAASPSIIAGLRIGFGMSFFVIVAAEFIAADTGLGFMINDARTFFNVPRMLLGAMVIGAIGFSFNIILRRVEASLLRWRVNALG